jgi:hypothetical protein
MSDNRRDTYRAKVIEPTTATLFIGKQKVPVCLTEESAGGLTIVTACAEFQVSTDAELQTYEGQRLRVKIVHCKPSGGKFQVGLQRLESAGDCVGASSMTSRPVSSTHYAAVLLLGLLLGWMSQIEAVQRYFAK